MNKIKLICIDVDGTLYNDDKNIPEENIKAIQKAHTELAWLQPWDEWRLRGKTYCSLNLIPIQCVYEPNI